MHGILIHTYIFYIHIYTYIFRSKLKLVEHSTITRYGEIQHRLLNEEYSASITKRLLTSPHRKNRADANFININE
jgi:hypothetical protein